MVYLTFDPSNTDVALEYSEAFKEIVSKLLEELPKLGVAADDIIIKTLSPHNTEVFPDSKHVEIILKTDSNRVTAPRIVEILSPILKVPYEVTRIYVGYEITEFFYEIAAFLFRRRRNWASNYDS